jgi:hypothetical protein
MRRMTRKGAEQRIGPSEKRRGSASWKRSVSRTLERSKALAFGQSTRWFLRRNGREGWTKRTRLLLELVAEDASGLRMTMLR